jgi:hypothetical protein
MRREQGQAAGAGAFRPLNTAYQSEGPLGPGLIFPVQQFENVTPGNCYHLPAGAAFLCSTKVCA